MDADGSNQVRLTHNLAREAYPTWSPSGDRIAFLSTRQGRQEIFLMNADGSNQVPLTHLEPTGVFRRHLAPAWSPNGAKIAFNRNEGETHEIFVIDPDGTKEARLTTDGGGWSAWSPDGTKIAFISRRDGRPGNIRYKRRRLRCHPAYHRLRPGPGFRPCLGPRQRPDRACNCVSPRSKPGRQYGAGAGGSRFRPPADWDGANRGG